MPTEIEIAFKTLRDELEAAQAGVEHARKQLDVCDTSLEEAIKKLGNCEYEIELADPQSKKEKEDNGSTSDSNSD